MKNRNFILVTLLLICALVPLQRAIATVTIAAVGNSYQVTDPNETGKVEFTVRVTSEAGDEYEEIEVSVTAYGLAMGEETATQYAFKPDPDKLDDIKGAGTQDVSIELDASDITKVDTITIGVDVDDKEEKLGLKLTLTLEVVKELTTTEIYVQGYKGKDVIHKLEEDEISDDETVDLDLNITNGETSSSTFTYNVTLPTSGTVFDDAYSVNIDTTQITMLPASGSVTLAHGKSTKVELSIPGSLLKRPGIQTFDGRSYFFKIVVNPDGTTPTRIDVRINVTVKAFVAELYLEALEGPTTKDGTNDITYTLRVTNAGNAPDGINFSIHGDVGTARVNQLRIELFPASDADITLTLPGTALSVAGTYNVAVTATSENNPFVTATVATKTTVTGNAVTGNTATGGTGTGDPSTPADPTVPLEPTGPDLSTHQVVISEFMFEASVGRIGLPQWIEVYNNSSSEVNLNGWKLNWTNLKPSPLDTTITIDKDFRIPAQQVRLIVTALGRHSGVGNLSDDAVYQFPPLVPIGSDQEILVSYLRFIFGGGFSLRLTNSNDVLVDQVGTLNGGKKRWDLPESLIEGDRSSLIRRFDEGVPRSGLLKRAWRRAYDAKGLVIGHYYGSPRDLGTPGYRRGIALPVELSQFSAKFVKDEVVISWTTESELNNAGFNIFRSTSLTKNFQRINAKLIGGAGTIGQRTQYQFIDRTAKPDIAYYYRLEDIDLSGTRGILTTYRLRGVITSTSKLMTTWGTLKEKR